MAQVRVTLKMDPRAIQNLLNTTTRVAATKATRITVSRAKNNAPKDTGRLARSIYARQIRGGTVSEWAVAAPVHYASYQERGTRAHGPRHAKFMVFTPKGSSQVVYAKWVRGVPATHFMQRAIDSIRVADFL